MTAGPPARVREVVVLFAHAAPQRSRVNRRLAEAARSVPGVELVDLYGTYPDFYIDVAAEQDNLADASALVFLQPIQWYGMPALLKEWVDMVLVPGWAYGAGASALQGKGFWLVASTGSPLDAYAPGATHGYPFEAFLPPYRQIAALCGMDWIDPHILHAAHRVSDEALDAHVDAFTARLTALASA
ncbi:glutathione-regulated potassium-efflux system oxidoreductase KefF [Massilia violaceinigra]|uniref:glutathione-regulated potassium-efflux system oxidoreductase KefF n=1 Tax=Massilia violaceinigra TaxID=2045208 RepID=UPI001E3D3071|nr:NAD(P)H-dependent oxidoreductase [Massilia violaceinigra]